MYTMFVQATQPIGRICVSYAPQGLTGCCLNNNAASLRGAFLGGCNMPEPKPRHCQDCGRPITRRATRCGSCSNRHRYEMNPAAWPKPSWTIAQRAQNRITTKRYMSDPVWKARWRKTVVPPRVGRGADHPAWKGGTSSEDARLRSSSRYAKWRKAVLARDDYTCQECGSEIDLTPHHIEHWAKVPDLRFVLSNGLTLCAACHSNVHGRRIRPSRFRHGYDACPQCDRPKTAKAKLCRSCSSAARRSPERKCPSCGAAKTLAAKMCERCYNRKRKARIAHCIKCGEQLGDCRSTRCRRCTNQLHNQNLSIKLPGTKRKIE